ncbi:mercuric transporter MerT family protein [Stieleria magnilauensis]|uniref:mercuric transporter MerT family protein n=1 Tax=Stieleria magnilauensis TaxID=2527963 RepID=UPI003AF6B5E6
MGNVGKGIKIAQAELDMSGLETEPSELTARRSRHKGETIAKVGTLVSAILASACCWLPLMLLAVGVSGVGIASTLEEYRPYFMVITIGFLGAAFYFTYRPKSSDSDCCVTEASGGDACCDTAARSTLSMLTVNKVMLWIVTAAAIAFLFFPSCVGVFVNGSDTTTVTEQMTQTVIKIEGMTCEGCSALVADAIKSAPGVLAVKVDYQKGEAIVGSESCCPFPQADVLESLQKAGYSGSLPPE